ncbi:MAG: hypothetical protein AB1349_01765 [Elusimicrobiota bacterium]
MELKKVIFEFENGKKKILTGKELDQWTFICMLHSDYLLPQEPDDILASMFNGLIRGFFSREYIAKKMAEGKVKISD